MAGSGPQVGLVSVAVERGPFLGQPGHLDRPERRLFPDVVASRALAAGQSLGLVLNRHDAEQHRHPGGELHILHPSAALLRDQLVVGCFTPNDRTDTDHCVDLARFGQILRGQRDFETAGYRDLDRLRHLQLGQAPGDPFGQPLDNLFVPPSSDDADGQAGAGQTFRNRCSLIP